MSTRRWVAYIQCCYIHLGSPADLLRCVQQSRIVHDLESCQAVGPACGIVCATAWVHTSCLGGRCQSSYGKTVFQLRTQQQGLCRHTSSFWIMVYGCGRALLTLIHACDLCMWCHMLSQGCHSPVLKEVGGSYHIAIAAKLAAIGSEGCAISVHIVA